MGGGHIRSEGRTADVSEHKKRWAFVRTTTSVPNTGWEDSDIGMRWKKEVREGRGEAARAREGEDLRCNSQ